LTIASDLLLPELPFSDPGRGIDVTVRLGEVTPELEGAELVAPFVVARPGALLIDYAQGRFLVTDGCDITIQPGAGTPESDVRAYLLGSAIGAILHQRGLFPLHANAVVIDGRATAFAGPSGAGKSTLAAFFQARGLHVLSDDVCALKIDRSGQIVATPGIPRIKLCSDTLAAFGRTAQGLERVVNWDDKFSLPLPSRVASDPVPLSRIYLLKAASDEPQITRLTGAAAFGAVYSNMYRSEFAAALGVSDQQFANSVAIATSVEVFDAERRLGFGQFESEAAELERHMLQVGTVS
jgi:hypothetical protein